MTPRVLLVDDEQRVLDGYRRNLHEQYDLVTAPGPTEGLAAMTNRGPFAVVVSDLQMPIMNGIEMLGRIRELAPDTTRIMLTGQADLDASIAAVNEGRVFRFLTKPCPAETLAAAIDAGVENHRLRRAEKELLEQTLRGTVEVLVEVLGLANQTGNDHAERMLDLVKVMAGGEDVGWELELATMLSQLGTITLPEGTIRKLADGLALDDDERRMVDLHPEAAFNLLSKIPRLDSVARMIRMQPHPISDYPDTALDDPIQRGALMIRTAAEYDVLIRRGKSQREAIAALAAVDSGVTAPLLQALSEFEGPTISWERADLAPDDVHSGMVIDADLHTSSGTLLLRKGEHITPGLLERLRSYAHGIGLQDERVSVQVPHVDRPTP